MSALAIESQLSATRPSRATVVRPAARPQRGAARATLPAASSVVPLRRAAVQSCSVQAPRVARPAGAVQPDLGEWHLTARGTVVVGLLMSLTMILGLVAVVAQFLAIPA